MCHFKFFSQSRIVVRLGPRSGLTGIDENVILYGKIIQAQKRLINSNVILLIPGKARCWPTGDIEDAVSNDHFSVLINLHSPIVCKNGY